MTPERYRLSFTTGGIFHLRALPVAGHYLLSHDWKQIRSRVRASNLLQVRTGAAALRISKEVVARLAELNSDPTRHGAFCHVEYENLDNTNKPDEFPPTTHETCEQQDGTQEPRSD